MTRYGYPASDHYGLTVDFGFRPCLLLNRPGFAAKTTSAKVTTAQASRPLHTLSGMSSHGTNRVLTIVAVTAICLLAIAAAAVAVISGSTSPTNRAATVTELPTEQPQQTESSTPEASSPAPSLKPTSNPEPTPEAEPTLEPVAEPPQATLEAPPETAFMPEPAPAAEPAVPDAPAPMAPEPTMTCPSGKVVSGLTDIAVQNQRPWIDRYIVDLVGHGSVHNGTTAAVDVWLYLPYIEGLDVSGNLTMNGFSGDFDYNPPKGTPRPGSISLAPGQTARYTFAQKDVTSDVMSETVAWYSDPTDPVSYYSDIDIQVACPDVVVSAPPLGPSIMNTKRSF
jgi:hypothetical protein